MSKLSVEQRQQINSFVEDLIQLQLKHQLLMAGYDNDFVFDENLTEARIREHWENYKVELLPRSGNLTE